MSFLTWVIDFDGFFRYQTSAKENENVNEAINFLVKKVIENVAQDADQSRDDTITLVANNSEAAKPEKQCCWNS